MWGIFAKALGWAIAHKTEIGAGISIWRRLRRKRVDSGKSAKDFYVGKGKDIIVGAALDVTEKDYSDETRIDPPGYEGDPE